MKFAFVFLAVFIGLSSIAAAGDAKMSSTFKVTTKRADDMVEIRSDPPKTVFAIKSPFGISEAVIERQEENWKLESPFR